MARHLPGDLLMLACGIGCLYLGYRVDEERQRFEAEGVVTQAEIIDITPDSDGDPRTPTVRFSTKSGIVIECRPTLIFDGVLSR